MEAPRQPASNYEQALLACLKDPRYLENLDWGQPRSGHPEGTIRAHIAELEENLEQLLPKLAEEEAWKLRLLVHTHDSFKPQAKRGVPITHPESHASLARQFLAEFIADLDLLNMVQFHDEPYALWRQARKRERCSEERLTALFDTIEDLELFVAFNLVDACTEGKDREPIAWWLDCVEDRLQRPPRFVLADLET